MSRARGWRWAHVLKHVPPAGGYFESGQITQVGPLSCPASKDVHRVVNDGGSVSFSRKRYVPNAVELLPSIGLMVVAPNITEPIDAICSTKPSECCSVLHVEKVLSIRLTDIACRSTRQ